MVLNPQTAIYDDYLEKKMRVVLEALVEALLTQKPQDVEGFCLDWLVQWHRDCGPERELLDKLKSERDGLLEQRDALLSRLSAQSAEAADSSRAPPPGSGFGSLQGSRSGSVDQLEQRSVERAHSITSDDPGLIAAEEAREREKIQRMKEKDRRAGVSAQAVSQERLQNWRKPFFEKSSEARGRLKKYIDDNEKLQVLFGHLRNEDIFAVIDAMFSKEVAKDENIITQGEEGDNFYIVEEGSFDVFVQRGDSQPSKVLEYGSGDMFGELALMYNAQRAATVTASSPAKLWALDRDSFQMMLSTAENTKKKQYEGFLESVAILQDLTTYERARLSDMLESHIFEKDEPIINQGEDGNYFYILEDGEAKAFIGGERGEIEVKHYQKPGEYFGEISLLKSATRRATVRAAGDCCSVLSVSRDDFDSVLGPIKDILIKKLDKYPEYADFIREEVAKAEDDAAEKEKIDQMKDKNRRQGVSAQALSEERMKDWKRPSYPKPEDVTASLQKLIAANDKMQVLFGHLTDAAKLDVIDAMKPQTVEKGERLITQGEDGDFFYIVDTGTFDAFVTRGDQPAGKVCEYGPGGMFGELAMMYNAPRAATVVCTSTAKVWALDRESFQLMLTTAENTRHTQYEGFLEKIDLFKHLTRYELSQLSDMLESELFDGGEEVIKQGDIGKAFYIVEDGEAKAYITGEKGEVEVKHYSEPGDYFGEVALITHETRRATVRACDKGCSVLQVSREDFDRVLGPIKETLAKNIESYPGYADVIREAMAESSGQS